MVLTCSQGRYGPKDYAILQSKPAMTETAGNENDLVNELALLGLGQWFLNSFYQCAEDFPEVKKLLPSMKWNNEDVFVGTVDTTATPISARPPAGETDNCTLLFPHFLATPLLSSGSQYREVKFSGNEDVGNNMDPVGEAVDAYAHHIVADSFGNILFTDLQGIIGPDTSVVLFDPQAHSILKSGYWDKGRGMIKAFLRQH
ncbi:hypothetical protein FIBSPDRAFT_762900 [Athelia psychrophila]|uniref:Alpha-type protein kinase domain-containing protein n=1 Tax=Athelia psychrophila TaxID=1759441 RepID=A0A167XQH6_9AGAM|nr:hypothetical protein FIBSPDRAFT_762900 [Fibularhizoctonia sp. CBS 109695]